VERPAKAAKAVDSREDQEHPSGRSMNRIIEAIRQARARGAPLAKAAREFPPDAGT